MSGAWRWAIAGFGWVARDFVAPAMAACGHRLVAVADPAAGARDAAGSFGASGFETLDALLASVAVDAVYVATPNHLHRDAVVSASRAGCAVLCEKPMAATPDDAQAMADAVRAGGIFYRTAFDQRHHPAHRAIRDLVADGQIGTLAAIRIVYACWLGSDWQADNWRIDRARAGGGALIDLAPHGIDLAAHLCNDEIEALHVTLQRRVHAYEVDDGAMVSARSRSGVLLSMHVAYNHPETLPRRRLELVGTGGMIVATDTMGQEPGGSVRLMRGSDGAEQEIGVDRELSPFEAQIASFAQDASRGTGSCLAALERDLTSFRLLVRAAEEARCR